MQSPPEDLVPGRLGTALANGWHLRAASMEYVPESGGLFDAGAARPRLQISVT